jgi:transposase
VRQLLRHRYKLICLRTSLKNQLHAVGRKELEGLSLGPWASRRRQQLLEMLDQLEPVMDELDRAVIQEAEKRPAAVRLMTQPGVGPVTALAFVLTIGPVERFPKSRKLVSYLG